MTKEEFEAKVIGNVGLLHWNRWRTRGFGAVPCSCGAPGCAGWQIGPNQERFDAASARAGE